VGADRVAASPAGGLLTCKGNLARKWCIPASKARDALKVAILPLSASGAEVTIELSVDADGGLSGIPRETLNLIVLEGLRQLGLNDVEVCTGDEAG